MILSVTRSFSLIGILLFTGCAARRYQPAPIVPMETAAQFQSRSLSDAGLQAFVDRSLAQARAASPPKTWDVRTLSLAALYFNPAMAAARARVAEAQAAILTVGARPNPTFSATPGVPSPYLLTLDLAVPIETAGKRGHRVQSARSLQQAAEFDLADTAWKLRSGIRAALLDYLTASRELDLLQSEEGIRGEQVNLLEQRFTVGEISRPDLDLARIELSKAHLAISAAAGQVGQTRAALAAAIGIPVSALQGIDLSWSNLDSPPSAESLSPQQMQRDAVVNRLDVRRALALYAAAEDDLQLEIAKQYPDVTIGPGYTYEEKNNFFTMGISTTLPIFNRNQGPIAEAEARRKGAAAAFLERQAQVIAGSEQALALYVAALREFAEADTSLRKLEDDQEQTTRRAVDIGEQDHLSLNGVQIESAVLAQGRLTALSRAQRALGQLEDSVQCPLEPGGFGPTTLPDPSSVGAPAKEPQP